VRSPPGCQTERAPSSIIRRLFHRRFPHAYSVDQGFLQLIMTSLAAGKLASAAVAGAALAFLIHRAARLVADPRPNAACLVGVLGGMGPKAGSQFFDGGLTAGRVALWQAMQAATIGGAEHPEEARLAAVRALSSAPWSSAEVESVWRVTAEAGKLDDEHHMPVLLLSPTQIPSRPRFLEGVSSEDPTEELTNAARVTVRAGATILCIVCNTAHFFWPKMLDALRADAAAGGPPVPRFLHMPGESLRSRALTNDACSHTAAGR